MDDPNPRKRPRSNNAPAKRGSLDLLLPNIASGSGSGSSVPDHQGQTRADRLRDPMQRATELNNLLRLSCGNDSFSLRSNAILKALAEIVVDGLGWKDDIDFPRGHDIVLRSSVAWKHPPSKRMQAWATFCRHVSISDPEVLRTLEVIAVILRNFSFAGNNLRLLAYYSPISCVLTAFLYISLSKSYNTFCQRRPQSESTLATSSLQTILHLARYLDVTGQQILVDKFFYDGSSVPLVPGNDYGQCLTGVWGGLGACWLSKKLDSKEDKMESIPTHLLLELVGGYLVAVWSLFPAIAKAITDECASRNVILVGLDVLVEFLAIARVGLVGPIKKEDPNIQTGMDYDLPTMRAVLAQIPDLLLERLTEYLFTHKSGVDAIDYVDPIRAGSQKIASTPQKYNQDHDSIVDTDVRDRTLDVIVPLLELDSPRMATRLGKTKPFEALLPILTTNVGRSEASSLASQALKELARSESNADSLMSLQPRLVELASRNLRVSKLVWEDLYPIVAGEDVRDNGKGGLKN